ncbi:hypothetical protein BH10BAC5_BH10BAC5_27310 [soil metagenome]
MSNQEPQPEDFGTTEEDIKKFNKRNRLVALIIFLISFTIGAVFIYNKNYDYYIEKEKSLGSLIFACAFGGFLFGDFIVITLALMSIVFFQFDNELRSITNYNSAKHKYFKTRRYFFKS